MSDIAVIIATEPQNVILTPDNQIVIFSTTSQVVDTSNATSQVVIKSDKANIAQFLSGGVYSLPANRYVFEGTVDFGTDVIELSTNNGFYAFDSTNFGIVLSSSVTPFITEASGVTGVLIDGKYFIISSPLTTAIKLTDPNSFIIDLVDFLLCDRPFDLDNPAFVTLEALPLVANNKGCLLNNSGQFTGRLLQFNNGAGLGAIGFEFTGGSSGSCSIVGVASEPVATESFIKFDASYNGDVQISSGVHSTSSGGDFFTAGSRDQTDVDILVNSVKNIEDSIAEVGAYIATADVAVTVLSGGVPSIIAGTWTLDSSERFTATAQGKFTYTGKETQRLPISCKMHVDPASGNNKEFNSWIRVNGTTLNLLSFDLGVFDAGNPGKLTMFTVITFETGDYIEIVIANVTDNINATCEANSLVIG